MTSVTFQDNVAARPKMLNARLARLTGVAAVALVSAGWFGVPAATAYWNHGRFVESTNNAYVRADTAMIAPRISGYIAAVAVNDNQFVKAGDVLAQIDRRDYQAAVDAAAADVRAFSATIQNIDAKIRSQQASIAEADADVEGAHATLAFATAEHRRYDQLSRSGTGSQQRAEETTARLRESQAALARSHAGAAGAREQLRVIETQRHIEEARLDRARADLATAKSALDDTTIVAPFDGVVGSKTARIGQMVQPGNALMAVVPLNAVYVVANFKETQLGNVRGGESVKVTIDTFPDSTITGRVDSVSPATGLEFSLLPSDNATGNFTKIVQRIPVKIIIEDDAGLGQRLRPGMSVEAEILTVDGN